MRHTAGRLRTASCGTVRRLTGSSGCDSSMRDALLFDMDKTIAAESRQRLGSLRSKLADKVYMDGAIGRLASFLSSRYEAAARYGKSSNCDTKDGQ